MLEGCKFCSEESETIKTTIGDHDLHLRLGEYKSILNVRIERGSVGITRPIAINYCPYCGRQLR